MNKRILVAHQRRQKIQEVFEEIKPLVEKTIGDGATPTSPDRNDGVPEELRKKKVAELKEMLEKEYVFLFPNVFLFKNSPFLYI